MKESAIPAQRSDPAGDGAGSRGIAPESFLQTAVREDFRGSFFPSDRPVQDFPMHQRETAEIAGGSA